MAFRVPLSSINASDGNVTYAQGSVLRVGAGGNVNAVGSVLIAMTPLRHSSAGMTNLGEWLRALGVTVLATIALSYHLKALFLFPVFAAASSIDSVTVPFELNNW